MGSLLLAACLSGDNHDFIICVDSHVVAANISHHLPSINLAHQPHQQCLVLLWQDNSLLPRYQGLVGCAQNAVVGFLNHQMLLFFFLINLSQNSIFWQDLNNLARSGWNNSKKLFLKNHKRKKLGNNFAHKFNAWLMPIKIITRNQQL